MAVVITNIDDLRAELDRLRQKKQFQENELKQHFNSPLNAFNTILSMLHRDSKGLKPFTSHQDIFTWLSKIALPFTLNKTLFRKSNFVIKSLVRMLSQNVSPQINEKSVNGVWSKLKGIIPGLKKKTDVKKIS